MPVSLVIDGHYLTMMALGVVALLGLIVANRFRRETEEDSRPATSKELLGPLERAYYSGLMREDEIERIRESVKTKAASPDPKADAAARTKPSSPLSPDDPAEGAFEADPDH